MPRQKRIKVKLTLAMTDNGRNCFDDEPTLDRLPQSSFGNSRGFNKLIKSRRGVYV